MILKKILKRFFKIINLANFRVNNVFIGSIKSCRGIPYIQNKGTFKIGKNLDIRSGLIFNPIGGDNRINFICKKNATLEIGNNLGISNATIFCSKGIKIGHNVQIGGSTKIWDTDHHSIHLNERLAKQEIKPESKEVEIGSNVWLGFNVLVLAGVKIGNNSVVAANSTVTKSIPANELWGGSPAKFIKKINL